MSDAAPDSGSPADASAAKPAKGGKSSRRRSRQRGKNKQGSAPPTQEENGVPKYLDGLFLEARVTAVASDRIKVKVSDDAVAEIPADEFAAPPAIDDTFTVFVDSTIRGNPLRYTASKEKADRVAPYDELATAFEKGTPVSGEVVSSIEGGFDVDVMGIRAFLPASQVGLRPVRNQFEVLGHEFNFKVIRFNKSRYNVVLSRKVLLGAERKQTFKRLREGAIVDGVVRSVVDFGAFVDLGAVEGLLHVTDMSYGRLGHPSKLVDVGDKLTVKVLKIDKKNRRISLGLKQLEDDPWVGADERYPKGKAVRGLVVSKTDFGCFIEVEAGLEGLVISKGPLVSDAARARLRRTEIGDEIEAVVLDLDLAGRRFSMRLKED